MSDDLLRRIQEAAVDSTSDLGDVLRLCKVLASRTGSKPLADWLIWECDGYPEQQQVPTYRQWEIEVVGAFVGPHGQLPRGPVPAICIPEKYRDRCKIFHCRQSVSTLRELLNERSSPSLQVSLGDLAVVLGTNVYQGMNCIKVWGECGRSALSDVLNAVRNKVLDFTLALEKEIATTGDGGDALTEARITNVFHTIVHGQVGSIGHTIGSPITVTTVRLNDRSSLNRYLEDLGVETGDLSELSGALEQEPTLPNSPNFGEQVGGWIAKMVGKAATGASQISVGTAGDLLTAALSRYYGL